MSSIKDPNTILKLQEGTHIVPAIGSVHFFFCFGFVSSYCTAGIFIYLFPFSQERVGRTGSCQMNPLRAASPSLYVPVPIGRRRSAHDKRNQMWLWATKG